MLKILEIHITGDFHGYTIGQSGDGHVGVYSKNGQPLILLSAENAAFLGQQLIAQAVAANKRQFSNIRKSVRKVSL